jgi:murein DD-endopeptidase MepM/ murein hydrolase activator NlpD
MKICYPVKSPVVVSQRWNENQEYYNKIGLKGHNGWDFAVPVGTPVYATHDGVIQFAGIDSVYSLTVSVCSPDNSFITLNCHLSESKVVVGDKVKRGDLIALSGNTGRYTNGPHLHFGVRPMPANMDNGYNGADDPIHYFDGTYPEPENDTLKQAKFALRDWQVSVGIMDFANETDYKKIKFGPKSQSLFNK